jgi:hypothetical protein
LPHTHAGETSWAKSSESIWEPLIIICSSWLQLITAAFVGPSTPYSTIFLVPCKFLSTAGNRRPMRQDASTTTVERKIRRLAHVLSSNASQKRRRDFYGAGRIVLQRLNIAGLWSITQPDRWGTRRKGDSRMNFTDLAAQDSDIRAILGCVGPDFTLDLDIWGGKLECSHPSYIAGQRAAA